MDNSMVEVKEENKTLVFGTMDASGVIERATAVANMLAPIVERAKLFSMIKTKQGPKKYVKAEGWTTMLSMLGIFPSTEYSKRLDRENEIVYEARVVLRHISGQVVGAGEAICSSKEANWANRDEFAIKSMAQTRAEGKAARLSFSWIMSLAGYEPTPAEEMTEETKPTVHEAEVVVSDEVIFIPATVNQKTGQSARGPWTLFLIKDSEDVSYSTFDKAYAELAKTAKEARLEVVVTYEASEKGNRLKTIRMHGSANA